MRLWLAAILAPLVCLPAVAAGQADFFEQRIRPLLVKNCYSCHTQSQLGGLRLDSREAILKGGKSGPAVVPGKPEDSILVQAVSGTHGRVSMPPQGKLADAAIGDLKQWIQTGANWPAGGTQTAAATPGSGYKITPEQRSFWAFQPVVKPAPPAVKDTSWPKNDVDRFILAKLEENGLTPARPASKAALIRRVTFDLTGLPPEAADVDAFLKDGSPEAFRKVVDRLLASPRYGERWGRHWLDLARYADGELGASNDTPYPNAFRYRDWVVKAFNDDLPYDRFIKAQIAADRLPEQRPELLPGLGFQALGHDANDQVDVTTRVFLGLTVGCAQCHDHKYDPIPTKDYYSLLGIFQSSANHSYPLAGKETVEAWDAQKKKIDDLREEINDFVQKQSTELSGILAHKTSRYMQAAWEVLNGKMDVSAAATAQRLDTEILKRWVEYLKEPQRDHEFLKPWDDLLARKGQTQPAEVRQVAGAFETFVLSIFDEQKGIEDRNYVKMGGAKGVKDEATRQYTNVESLEPKKFYLWRDLASEPYSREGLRFKGGIYYFGVKSKPPDAEPPVRPVAESTDVARFLPGEWADYLESRRSELAKLEAALPPRYPFLHGVQDKDKPGNIKVAIRGDAQNPGEEAPRRFLQILCATEPALYTQGSGRLELAESVASKTNPLTARVMVNRLWHWHFGRGIVPSPSNFGQLGERPSHPELLDYLAAKFAESGWSVKAMHRELLLSAAYAMSSEGNAQGAAKDPDNRLLWRANLQLRLDAESLRDALLAVAGNLDPSMGGPPRPISEDMRRRTLYAYVGRTKRDPTMSLFDFPNPNASSEQRTVTVGPLQRLYFLNNPFVLRQSAVLSERIRDLAPGNDRERIDQAYRLLFGRPPSDEEQQWGLDFLAGNDASWQRYAQVLLASSEFSSVP